MAHELRVSRRKALLIGAAALLTPESKLHARETEFWNRKSPEQWSESEIDQLITNSPWAKEVKIPAGYSDAGARAGGAGRSSNVGIGIPGLGGLGIPGLGGGLGRGRRGSARMPEVKSIVRWESAKPVLAALKTTLPSAFADHYVISISGVPPAPADHGAEADLDKKKGVTYLDARGKSSIQPGSVQKLPGATGETLLFGFFKQLLELSADDGDITFSTQIDLTHLKVQFKLRDMVYHSELAV